MLHNTPRFFIPLSTLNETLCKKTYDSPYHDNGIQEVRVKTFSRTQFRSSLLQSKETDDLAYYSGDESDSFRDIDNVNVSQLDEFLFQNRDRVLA